MEERNFVILTAAHPDFSNEEVRYVSSGFVSAEDFLQHYSAELYAVVPESAFESEPSFFREKSEEQKLIEAVTAIQTAIGERRAEMANGYFSNTINLQKQFAPILPQVTASLDIGPINPAAFDLAYSLVGDVDLSSLEGQAQVSANDFKNQFMADILAIKQMADQLPV